MPPPNYLQLSQSPAHPNPYAADAINTSSALSTLAFQKQQENQAERAYRRDWWKRGLAKGAMGAIQGGLTGLASGNPAAAIAGAGAGLAGGFGGEALNHAAFKDQNESLGNAGSALGALAGQGVGNYLRPNPSIGLTSAGAAMSPYQASATANITPGRLQIDPELWAQFQ